YEEARTKLLDLSSKYVESLKEKEAKISDLKVGTKGREKEELSLQKIKDKYEKDRVELTSLINLLNASKDKPHISKTTISYLLSIYIEVKYGRREEIVSKYLEKGIQCEDEAISLVCDVIGEFLVKNNKREFGEFTNGECDI